MSYETRLKRLEEETSSTTPEPPRFLLSFVDPDPAVGVVSVLAMAAGMETQLFDRKPGESFEHLRARAVAAVGWRVAGSSAS